MTNYATALNVPRLPFPPDPEVQRVAREVSFNWGFADIACPVVQHGGVAAWEASGVEHIRREVGERTSGFATVSVAAVQYLLARHDKMEERLGLDPEPSRGA